MTNQVEGYESHERARRLIDQDRVEGLGPEDRRWLEVHLAKCEDCAAWSASTEAALKALKSISIRVPPGLAASASLRVREKAAQLKQRRARTVALVAGCGVSWAAGVASAPLVWRLCEWVGTTLALPRLLWELGFFSWWLVPAAAAGLIILWVNARVEREEYSRRLETGRRANE